MSLHPESPVNERAKRSREALQAALLRLIISSGYDNITIQDIADGARTARVTFYRHYKDKESLLMDALDSARARLLEELQDVPLSERANVETMMRLFQHIQENANLYRGLFASLASLAVVNRIRDYIAEGVMEVLSLRAAQIQTTPIVPIEMMAQHIAGAHIGVLIWWLDTDFPYPAEYMAQAVLYLTIMGQARALGVENPPLAPPPPFPMPPA